MKRTPLHARILPSYTRGEELMNMITHIVGGALGLAGYMEYFVQRNGHRALLAYTVMSGAMMVVMLTGLVVRCIGNWHMTRKVSPVTEVIPVAVPELQEIPEAEAEAVEAAEALRVTVQRNMMGM